MDGAGNDRFARTAAGATGSAIAKIPYRIDPKTPMTAPHPTVLEYPFDAPPPPGVAREVAPGIRWLRMPLPFALDHINLWLLGEGERCTLVDCGYGDAPTRALWERHFADSLGDVPLARIVATHYHPDHLGNAAWLAARFGCAVVMTEAEFLSAYAIFDQRATHALSDALDRDSAQIWIYQQQ